MDGEMISALEQVVVDECETEILRAAGKLKKCFNKADSLSAIKDSALKAYLHLGQIYDRLDDYAKLLVGKNERDECAQLLHPDIHVQIFDAADYFQNAGDEKLITLQMPLPPKRIFNRQVCPLGCELRNALFSIAADKLKSFKDGIGVSFVFEQSAVIADHDNYCMKPIIDSIAAALFLTDRGDRLAQQYFSFEAPYSQSHFYLLIYPLSYFGLRIAEIMKIVECTKESIKNDN